MGFKGSGAKTATVTATALSDAGFLNATSIKPISAQIQLSPAAGANMELHDPDGNIMAVLTAGTSYSLTPNPDQHHLPNICGLKVKAASGTVVFYVSWWM